MGKIVGRDGVLKSGANTIAHVRNWTINEQSPQVDLTAMGDSFADQAAGLPQISGNFSLWWDDAGDTGQGTITNGAEFTLQVHPEGESSGNVYWEATIAITEIVRTASHDGGVEMNVNFVGRSVVTENTTV